VSAERSRRLVGQTVEVLVDGTSKKNAGELAGRDPRTRGGEFCRAGGGGRWLVGQTVEVLVDGTSKKNAGELAGRTRCNRVVNFDGQGRASVGEIASVRIDQALPHSLRGTLASL